MIAREEHVAAEQREAEMVGSVTGRMQRLEAPFLLLDHVAVGELHVGREDVVDELGALRIGFGAYGWEAVAAIAHDGRSRCRLERRGAVHMVAMGVRDEDLADGAAGGGLQDGGRVGLVGGAGIDDRELRHADEVSVGALEGEGARIAGDDAHDAGTDRRRLAIGEMHGGLERQIVRHRRARPVGCSRRRTLVDRGRLA